MTDNSNVKDRILQFINRQGLRKSEFERLSGLSNGYINNFKGNLGPGKLNDILKSFPALNRIWLLTGEGEMLNKSEGELEETGVPFPENDFQRSILKAISAVEKIAESNRVLAESNHELTTTNKILATSNTELVQKLAGLLDEIREMRSATVAKYPPVSDQPSQVASDIDSQYGK